MLTPSGHWYRQSKLLGEAVVFRWGQVLQSGWHGGWLDSAQFVAETSQLLALQRHHRVPAQLLSQCAKVLDVIQPVCLPLVFDTCGDTPTQHNVQTLHNVHEEIPFNIILNDFFFKDDSSRRNSIRPLPYPFHVIFYFMKCILTRTSSHTDVVKRR